MMAVTAHFGPDGLRDATAGATEESGRPNASHASDLLCLDSGPSDEVNRLSGGHVKLDRADRAGSGRTSASSCAVGEDLPREKRG